MSKLLSDEQIWESQFKITKLRLLLDKLSIIEMTYSFFNTRRFIKKYRK